ncbi:MAG: hypothetical protein IPH07_06745 [Deltaproteobacteria bacterium]|nr:hypothetical protein [Deltaproteobacteria bacterium]
MLLPLVISVFVDAPTVQWHAPPQCPDASAFEARLGALLGDAAAYDAQAVVTVEPDPEGGFVAQVRCSAGGDETIREVRGPMCESVADAAALVLAVQIDALAVEATAAVETRPLPPPPLREPDRAALPAPVRPPTATPAPPPRRARRLRGAVIVGGGGSFRQVPAPSPAVTVGGALLLRRARVELDATWVPGRTARLPAPDTEAGARVGLVTAALRAGFVPTVRTVSFPLLAGLEVGDMTALGVGVTNPRRRHGAWVAALVGAGIAWAPVPRFALRLDPTLALAIARPRFGVAATEGVRPLPPAPVVGVRLAATIEVRFP